MAHQVTIDVQVFSDIRTEFIKWLKGGSNKPNRYVGDDGRLLFLDEYPFWSVDQQTAAQTEWNRLQGGVAQRRSDETDRRAVSQ